MTAGESLTGGIVNRETDPLYRAASGFLTGLVPFGEYKGNETR